MAHLTLTAHGDADPAEVWERYAMPSRWSTWSPQIRSVTIALTRIRAGATGRVNSWFGTYVDFVVEEVDEQERTWSWSVTVPTVALPVQRLSFVRLPKITLHLHHAVHHHGAGTQTSLRIDGPLPVIAGYAPLAQLALRKLVRQENG